MSFPVIVPTSLPHVSTTLHYFSYECPMGSKRCKLLVFKGTRLSVCQERRFFLMASARDVTDSRNAVPVVSHKRRAICLSGEVVSLEYLYGMLPIPVTECHWSSDLSDTGSGCSVTRYRISQPFAVGKVAPERDGCIYHILLSELFRLGRMELTTY